MEKKLTHKTFKKEWLEIPTMQNEYEMLDETYLASQRLERPAKRWTLNELEKDIDLEG